MNNGSQEFVIIFFYKIFYTKHLFLNFIENIYKFYNFWKIITHKKLIRELKFVEK